MRLRSLRYLVVVWTLALPGAASAGDHEGTDRDVPFLAIDVGAEAGAEVEATAGLVLGVESHSNNFLISAALTRAHGATSFADVALGYYRSFDLGWLTPEVGVEIGVLNESLEEGGRRVHHMTALERVGGALLHHFENHMFAGLVSDVNFAMDEFANVRGLFELGFQL